mgnify:CR=1 FL=1
MKELLNKGITRRDFLKVSGLATAGAVLATASEGAATAQSPITGKRLGMVIDLQKCGGCGACCIVCKNENNVQAEHYWAGRISRTFGVFPNTGYEFIPTLCNHCEKAPCAKVCPTGAMHKGDGNITMHDPDKCMGCRYCIIACPYQVIHFNDEKPHKFWRDDTPLMEGMTASPVEVTQKVGGTVIPYYNPAREGAPHESGLRFKGIVEKCTLCYHRVIKGELPYCVESCPANARIFGDLNDPESAVSKLLLKHRGWRLKEGLGTEPKVYYIRDFNPADYERTKGSV